MTVVNGRKGRDAFTCVSGIGAAQWWITACKVGKDNFGMIEGFESDDHVRGC